MKKSLLVAALWVAGLVSAKGNVITEFLNKLKYSFFLLFFFLNFFSQKKEIVDSLKQEFNYLYKYQPDSLNNKDIREEYFVLKVGDKKTLFVSENQNKKDSVLLQMKMNFERKTGNFSNFSNVPKSRFNYYIVKQLQNNGLSYFSSIGTQLFYYDETIDIKWEILSEKKIIDGVDCQLAEGRYGGRIWKAWFTEKIPIALGPYKFFGLPGLIVKIEDKKSTHSFSLIRYKYYNTGNKLIVYSELSSAMNLQKNKLLEAQKSDKEELVERFKMMGGAITAEKEKEYRDRLKRNNNPIELKN